MKLKERINHYLPVLDDLHIIADASTKDRKRSLWLGVSQAILNTPRVLFAGLWKFLWFGSFLFMSFIALFLIEVIVAPVSVLLLGIYFGIRGQIVDEGDEVLQKDGVEKAKFALARNGFVRSVQVRFAMNSKDDGKGEDIAEDPEGKGDEFAEAETKEESQ